MKTYSVILSAMSNSKRLEILTCLSEGESSVNALAERVGLSQSALSQHLAKLRRARLVSSRRESQTIYYSVDSPAVAAVLDALDSVLGPPKMLERRAKDQSAGK